MHKKRFVLVVHLKNSKRVKVQLAENEPQNRPEHKISESANCPQIERRIDCIEEIEER